MPTEQFQSGELLIKSITCGGSSIKMGVWPIVASSQQLSFGHKVQTFAANIGENLLYIYVPMHITELKEICLEIAAYLLFIFFYLLNNSNWLPPSM